MSSRRRAAAASALIALLLVVVGVLPWTDHSSTPVRVLSVLVLAAGAFAALVAWGLLRSTGLEVAEARLDAAVTEAAGLASGPCDCGQDHDPDEMHVVDAPACGSTADACAHNCDTCILAAQRA